MKRLFCLLLLAILVAGLATSEAAARDLPVCQDPKSGDGWPDDLPDITPPPPPDSACVPCEGSCPVEAESASRGLLLAGLLRGMSNCT